MQEIEELTRSGMLLGNHVLAWLTALAVFAGVYLLAPRLRFFVARRLEREGVAPTNIIMRSLHALTRSTRSFFLFAVALWAGTQFLVLPVQIDRLISGIVLLATMIQAGLWSGKLIGLWVENNLGGVPGTDPARSSAAQIIRIICLTVVWSAILLVALSNFGVDITGLVAGLGIGGIAIAFALQSILKDLFASLAIILDKPFMVGDFIIFDDHLGSVEQIGLKTTRVRALSGEQISVSNDALLNTRVRNFKRMKERRIVFDLHTHHGAPIETLKALPGHIRTVIQSIERTRFDRAHLADFDEVGPRFETVYFVLSPDFNVYMDIHQQILVGVAEWFEANGLEFAHPSRRVIIEREAGTPASQETPAAP